MPGSSKLAIAQCWLPFLGKKMGLAKGLSVLSVDPDDFDLHQVFTTTTSLSRLLGYTGEFEPRAGGAGIRLEDAINRAMGELVERYASLAFDGTGKIVSSRKMLLGRGCRAAPLDSLALFSPEQLATPGFAYAEFTEDTAVGWIEGTNLADGLPIFVPGQLVSMGYLPDPGEVSRYFYPTSSGCALGTSVGILVFTFVFLRDLGMPYQTYRAWLTVLLSFTSLISNAGISYYFAHKAKPRARRRQSSSGDIPNLRKPNGDPD